MTYDEIMLLDEDGLNLAVAKAIALRGEVAERLTCMTDDSPGGEEMECQGDKTPEEIQHDIKTNWGYSLELCYLYSYEDKEHWGVVPEWSTDIGEAWELVGEWTSAPVPNNGHHEVSLVYEDWDGTRPISWHCQFERFTEVESDFAVYYSGDCETVPVAICRAFLLWKAEQP